MVPGKVRKRLKQLLALARSPPEPGKTINHEAASARASAEELMAEYGLTEADVLDEEHAVPEADDEYAHHRQNLALAAAVSRGVRLWRKDGALHFRGTAAAARDAADHYRQLRDAAGMFGNRLLDELAPIVGWPDSAPGVFARWYFWQSFVEACRNRMGMKHLGLDGPPPEDEPAPQSVEERDLTQVEADVCDAAIRQIGQSMTMVVLTRVQQAAKDAAKEAGAAPYRPGQRALGGERAAVR